MSVRWIRILLVVLFIFLFFTIRSCEEAEAATTMEVGGIFDQGTLSGGVAIANEVFDGKYAVGIGWTSPQRNNGVSWKSNTFVQTQRYVTWKRITLGLGAAYWKNTDPAVQKGLYFTELIQFKLFKNVDLNYRHWSTGGSGWGGYDSLLLGIRFR